LGPYNNFPTNIHGIAAYKFQTSTQQLQKTILDAFYQLNLETLNLKSLTRASPPNCQVNFELGIAEEDTFNFIDKEELQRLQKSMEEGETPPVLDFFCATRYHTTTQNGKTKPLKFDYTLLRFTFHRRIMEMFVVHERGTQRIPLEDLVTFLTNRINTELTKKRLKTLTVRHMRTL